MLLLPWQLVTGQIDQGNTVSMALQHDPSLVESGENSSSDQTIKQSSIAKLLSPSIEKKKAKRAARDFKCQQNHNSGVALINFQVMLGQTSEKDLLVTDDVTSVISGGPKSARSEKSVESTVADTVTLVEISQNERAMEHFVQYCIKSSFINELLFWLNIEYSLKTDPLSRGHQFRNVKILTKYLDTNTEYHVQIPSKALPKTFFKQLQKSQGISKEVMASAHSYVERYINKEVVPFFVKSRYADPIRDKPPITKTAICIQIRVSGYRKCYEETRKFYKYEMECQVDCEKIYIYKTFDEFVENHRALCNKFPKEKFPQLPTRGMLRGENERNAKRKMKDLSVYMENLLDLSDHITQSYEMNTFLDFDSFLQNKLNKASTSRERHHATPTHLASSIHESVASTAGLNQQPSAAMPPYK